MMIAGFKTCIQNQVEETRFLDCFTVVDFLKLGDT